MMLSGIFKGQWQEPYNFIKDGKTISGTTNKVFIEIDEPLISPLSRLKVLSCVKDYKSVSVVGKKVDVVYDIQKNGSLKLLSESLSK